MPVIPSPCSAGACLVRFALDGQLLPVDGHRDRRSLHIAHFLLTEGASFRLG
jgi:hypothetical protein